MFYSVIIISKCCLLRIQSTILKYCMIFIVVMLLKQNLLCNLIII